MAGLKDAFGGCFEMGVALGGRVPDALIPEERWLVQAHFNNITPENCMKPEPVEPEEGRFDFEQPDALVAAAQDYRMHVTGHCLVWHQQCPEWFFRVGTHAAPRELVLRRMRTHIHTLIGRYGPRVQGWDVVNEAIDDGPGFIRESLWKTCVGEDYVAKSFEFAQEAAGPDVRLYYNDYNIELPEKRAKALRLLQQLRDRGLRVDAVGIQAHWILDRVPFEHLEAAIEAFGSAGVKVMITELDLDVVPRDVSGADPAGRDHGLSDPYVNGCPADVLARQAEQYSRLFGIFRRHRDKITRVAFWGLHDGRSWLNYWPRRRTNHPLLFDRQCRPKPAFAAVLGVA
jgi:endo-1,4-beta-xylanase